nr:MAG TPA: hypothetical protein [Caudoviricetes sp.]
MYSYNVKTPFLSYSNIISHKCSFVNTHFMVLLN